MSRGKKYKENISKYDSSKEYSLDDALSLLSEFAKSNFDESVDLSVNLGVDPRHADQLIRGAVSLPNGTGKKVKAIVVTKEDDKAKKCIESGAIDAGSKDLLAKIEKGWLDFDVMIASPDMMPQLGKLGKLLGPRGLMPNPKVGTVTNEVEKCLGEVLAGKVEYRVDKNGIINVGVGKASFDQDKIKENILTCMGAILRAKPASVKGTYFEKLTLSSTMGPGIKILKSDFTN